MVRSDEGEEVAYRMRERLKCQIKSPPRHIDMKRGYVRVAR